MTPSTSRSQAATPSGTQSSTSTQSVTTGLTPSATPHPVTIVFDNTQFLSLGLDPVAPLVTAANTGYAVSFQLFETDPACGPGIYVFTSLVLALSRPASTSVPVLVTVSLLQVRLCVPCLSLSLLLRARRARA
jgi:hypothetical protein